MKKAELKTHSSSAPFYEAKLVRFFIVAQLTLMSCSKATEQKSKSDQTAPAKKSAVTSPISATNTSATTTATHIADPEAHKADPEDSDQIADTALADNIQVLNSQRFAVQVYASQNAVQAQERAKKLSRLGYDAREVEAQVPDHGLWHRVIFGDWSSRAQAQIAGDRYSQDSKATAICASGQPSSGHSSGQPKGPSFIIRNDILPMEINPRLGAALSKNALGQKAQTALVQSHNDSEPAWALLAVEADNKIRLLDVTGGLHSSWPLPQWQHCPICQQAFSGQDPKSVKLIFAGSLAPEQADFVLSEYHFAQGDAAQWTQMSVQGQSEERLSYPVQLETAEYVINTKYKLVEADGDDGFEIMLSQWQGTLHEGDLCDVQVKLRFFDPGSHGLEEMNQSYYKKLADQNLSEARGVFDQGLKLVMAQKTSAQGLFALAGFGRSTASLTEGERKENLLKALLERPNGDAAIYQAIILSDWIAVHPSQPIALAAEVIRSLDRLLADKRFAVSSRSCDDSPLARKGQWSGKNLQKWAQASSGPYDLRRLPVTFFATMAKAYDVDTPAGKKLEQLAQRLRPASAIYKKIRTQLDQAWSIDKAQ